MSEPLDPDELTSELQGTVLWEPPADARSTTRMGAFLDAVEARRGVDLPDYAAAWEWSVTDLEGFWSAVVAHFGVRFVDQPTAVLPDRAMPGAEWFPGATLNYAEHALRATGDRPAVVARSQTRDEVELSADELRDQVARAAAGLRRLGVGRGDRVAAYAPNIPETTIAFLATASLGAVWSSCAPEFGTTSVVERIAQIEPKVLLAVDGYRYGTKEVDRTGEVAEIRAALPSLEATVAIPYLHAGEVAIPDAVVWDELVAVHDGALSCTPVPFDHPLYVLYSSGTTGLPKPIVHGHGGILLEHLKVLALHQDLGEGDRLFWFTTTGWMMWNYVVSGLLVGATIVLFDGDPGHPDLGTLWRLADETGVTAFGVSAPYLMSCRKAGLSPARDHDLSALRSVGSTGAPLPPEGYAWVYDEVDRDVLLASISGGTDVCTAFVLGCPLQPVRAGELQVRGLGAKVEAYDASGRPVIGERGELVITEPMPSMPVGFWGDDDGSRYREAYFDVYPGVWRHGDWIRITEHGSAVITGRSDATLNRGGVRMGTSEFYTVVEDLDEVTDSLVVHLDDGSEAGRLVLFVALADGGEVDDDLRRTIAGRIREQLSPRHVPDEVHAVPAVPRTLSGKKLEVPVKRMLAGADPEQAASRDALANPEALDWFAAYAVRRRG
ncbi:MAG: acetoacetate--CoA ligase [Actinobacteria bacterium]|nr:acetoacetate--CoA ligase [Actinomycetota bacterium]